MKIDKQQKKSVVSESMLHLIHGGYQTSHPEDSAGGRSTSYLLIESSQ
jgi:hypothetical protein